MSIAEEISKIKSELPQGISLVAVSKFHPAEEIMQAYDAGQRLFGESRPQEFEAKCKSLPSDIKWHFIGHLQTNKLKMVLPYAWMIESVDSVHLLEEICKWSRANALRPKILLEMHLGAEETKHGMTEDEIRLVCADRSWSEWVEICGLMGMATNTDDESIIRSDSSRIAALKDDIAASLSSDSSFKELSIGMSGDYKIAIEYGATIVRIGTLIFGPREY